MSKILLTGMTAPQCSRNANIRSLNFAGVIYKVLSESGHDVVWEDPDIKYTREYLEREFDSVIVGVGPLTALGANRVYGALSIIGEMWGSSKLSLLIDGPQFKQITVALRAIETNPDSLIKPFYAYRKGYKEVFSNEILLSKLLNTVSLLLNSSEWPTTIYPKLPWKTPTGLHSKLPEGAVKALVGLNLDAHLLENKIDLTTERANKWVYDESDTKWAKSTLATLGSFCAPMKINRGASDLDVEAQIARSRGALISPSKDGNTWWSYRYIQALNTGTLIATEWKDSAPLGEAWNILAPVMETFSQQKMDLVATAQRESYFANIPSRDSALRLLASTIKLES